MANFFKNKTLQTLTERERLERTHKTCRANLLLLVVITLINVFSAAFGSDTYFLFTATIPHINGE